MTRGVTIDEGRRLVLAATRPLPAEDVALGDALGRVLAEEVTSTVDVPPFDSSAMDGFALPREAEGELAIHGEARAGHPAAETVTPGAAIRISTGAAVPDGAAAVVPVERVQEADGRVSVPRMPPGANIRRAGEDVRAGDTVLRSGSVLGPAALGVLASIGRSIARCARRPRLGLLATGDELVDPGAPLPPGGIWSSNAPALAAQAACAGATVTEVETVPDDRGATREALARAVERSDLICVSGGVSVGPHDHVKGALAALGFDERFWGVALRPGRPTWFGVLERPAGPVLAFGLPGNPVSAMVTFQLFALPAVRALQGADPAARRATAVLASPVERHPRREQAVRCRLRAADDGWHAEPTGPQGSHVLTSMLAADALALVPSGEGPLAAGERVAIEMLDGPARVSSAP